MSYCSQCSAVGGYAGFFDELQKVFQVAVPTVGGLQGFTAGQNDGGGLIGGLIGGLSGVAKGFASVTPKPVTYSPTGVSMPIYQDSLLGTPQQQNVMPQIIPYAQQYPQTYILPTQTTTTTAGIDPKWLLYGGVAFAALLTIILATRK